MLKMVDGTGIIGVDMVCPLGGTVSPPQPPNYDMVEVEGVGSLMLPNSLKAPLERVELLGNSVQPTTTGKNLFDESKAVTGRINPDNGERLPETSYISSDYIEVQEGETYFQSGSGDGYYRAFYDMNKKFTSIPTKGIFKITVPVGSKFLRISGRKERFGDWMIEKGDKATSYEPYTGGKPSPSPEYPQEIKSAGKWNEASGKYLLDVKVIGKNLIPDTVGFEVGSFNYNTGVNASLSDRGRLKEYIPIVPGKKYLVTVNGNTSIDDIGVHFLDINRFPVAGYGSARFISPLNAYYVRIRYKGWTENDKVSLQLQDTSLDYEPYTEQSVQIALDEPLRGIGEYKDTITKDGVVRKIHEQTLKKEQISMNEYNWDIKYFRLRVNPDKKIDSSINIHELFSNMFKKFVIYKGNPNVYWIISEEEIRSMGITETDSLQVAYEKIKDFVTTNDIVIQYPIAETTLEPLPESVQAQLSSLYSENGTTHVFVDSGEVPCGIKLTYRKEK